MVGDEKANELVAAMSKVISNHNVPSFDNSIIIEELAYNAFMIMRKWTKEERKTEVAPALVLETKLELAKRLSDIHSPENEFLDLCPTV